MLSFATLPSIAPPKPAARGVLPTGSQGAGCWSFGKLALNIHAADGHSDSRVDVPAAAPGCWRVVAVQAGVAEAWVGNRSTVIPAQAVLLLGPQSTDALQAQDGCVLHVLSLPAEALAAPLARSGRGIALQHGGLVEGTAGGILSDHMAALADHLPRAGMADADALAGTTLQLVLACLRAAGSAHGSGTEAAVPSRRFWLHRVWRYVDEHLPDPRLSPNTICEELGLSRSTLYRHFGPAGGLAAHIRRRRVDAVRSLLQDPRETRPIAELARLHGFASNARFCNVFRRYVGHAPSAERARFTSTEPRPADTRVSANGPARELRVTPLRRRAR